MSAEIAGPVPGPEPEPSLPDKPGQAPRSPEDAPDGPPPDRPPAIPAGEEPRRSPADERAQALGPGGGGHGEDEHPDVADRAEEKLDSRSEATSREERKVRDDIPAGGAGAAFSFGDHTTAGDFAGHDFHKHFHYYSSTYFSAGGKSYVRGPVVVSELARIARIHVPAESDGILQNSCGPADRMVFLRGGLEGGRRSSAIRVLDEITGMVRTESKVSVIEADGGLSGLAGRLAEGHGHLLDASDQDWLEEISEAQIGEIREALEQKNGYLVVLIPATATPPVTPVEHRPPDPARVVRSHLAAFLADPAEPVTPGDFAAAEALLRDAFDASAEARQWEQELATPVEAAYLAMAITEWAKQRAKGEPAPPRIRYYRYLRLYRQARVLLGRGDRNDSPLRQAYVIATAALDGMPVSEVADQARGLAVLLAKAEGSGPKRRLFAETLAHWLSHAEMVAAVSDRDGTGADIVRLRSRELARILVEVAWLDYDAAREPMRDWLVRICEEHRDVLIRVRAAQALAYIAVRDYRHVKANVLDRWSESDRLIEHQAAAWLLEAAVAADVPGGRMKARADALLRRWSRLMDERPKRAIAVRAYGIGAGDPEAALSGIRISAADPYFGTLPELALSQLYADGRHRIVMRELVFWTRAYPVMRERVGPALVRISWILHADQPGCYDLLWRMAHEPASADLELDALGRLWKIACEQEESSGPAWKSLGEWAKSSRRDPAQRDVFTRLADVFEKAVDRQELRERFRAHRRQWNRYLEEEF
jgi:hypothetical protein